MIGPRPLRALPGDVGVVAGSRGRFEHRLTEGDAFVRWILRHGCALHDPKGVRHAAYERISDEAQWLETLRKFERATALAGRPERMLAIEDDDSLQEHVRAALTSQARGLLRRQDAPLARAKLRGRRAASHDEPAGWLPNFIHEPLGLHALGHPLMALCDLFAMKPGALAP